MRLKIKNGRVDFYNHNYCFKFLKFSIKSLAYGYKFLIIQYSF